jgi:hypothetical protein
MIQATATVGLETENKGKTNNLISHRREKV